MSSFADQRSELPAKSNAEGDGFETESTAQRDELGTETLFVLKSTASNPKRRLIASSGPSLRARSEEHLSVWTGPLVSATNQGLLSFSSSLSS